MIMVPNFTPSRSDRWGQDFVAEVEQLGCVGPEYPGGARVRLGCAARRRQEEPPPSLPSGVCGR